MFFVRERSVKIIGILLLLNVSWISGELPASSYLPPNRDDQSGKFSAAIPTGQNYNTNSAPIETSISLTTSEPFSYNPSSFGSDSGETRNPPSNTYGPPHSDNLPNNRIPSNIRGNNNNNGNDFNQGGPVRNQQSPVGNNGYSYQQPSPPFQNSNAFSPGAGPNGGQNQPAPTNPQQQNSFGSIGPSHGGQNYQPTGPTNSPQSNSFGPAGGQGYQSAGPTNSPSGISSSYFNSPSPSLSPTYGPPVNTSGNFGGGRGNVPVSSSNLPERKPAGLSPYTSPNSFMPSSNSPISGAGNSLGFPPGLPGLSTSYGPPSPLGNSFGNLPSFGGNFNPGFNPFGSGNAPLNPNRNQYPSSGPTNIQKGQPSNNFGTGGTPQALYGVPTPNGFADNTNLPSRRPSGNFGGIGSPQTSYSPPIPSIQTSSDRFSPLSPQGNRNKGTFGPPSPTYGAPSPGSGPPSPTYGPPTNSFPPESSSQSFRPQEFERLSQQNNRPINNFSPGYQNTSNVQSPPPQSYGTPLSNTPNVGLNRGQTQDGPYPSSGRPFSSISSPNPNNFNSAPNLVRPSSPSQILSNPSSPQTGYPQRVQNQQSFSPNFGSPPNQGNRTSYTTPSNIYQPPSQSFSGGNTPQSSYLPPSLNTFSNPSGSRLGTNGGYENSRSPSSSIASSSGFGASGGNYEASRSPNVISSSSTFGNSETNGGPTLPTNAIPSDGGYSTSGSSYEAPRPSTNAIPSRSPSSPSSLTPLHGTPSTNFLNQGFSTPNQQGYPGPASPSGFSNISPTTEASRPSNFNSLSPSYGPPTRDYTDALLGDYSNPTYPEPGNSFLSNTNSFGEFSSPDGNTQPSGSPPSDQGTPAQSAYSGFSPNPSSIGESPERLYGAPKPTNDFTNEQNSLPFTGTGSTNTEIQPQLNFGTNPASSYLPPNQSGGTAFNNDDVVPSTSYTLPSDQPNSSRPGTSNTAKNTHRNVGSDLITGASTSPFLPFKDDSTKPNAAPSRATYEKSQEVTSNDLGTSGYYSGKPAKYQFNYDVKGFGPEFSHQESRNGSTTSGSYGVVLPDGRKQVVDYEANQEGFHPKIRYEESPNNSLQQNNDQNQGYNYSPSIPSAQNSSQPFTPNVDSFNNQGSSSSYPDSQQSYPSKPDYSLGTVANQGSYTSPYDSSSPQSGYPINEGSASNFNTYINQGTSPSNPDGSTFDSNPSSQFDDNRGYDYTPGGNSNNQATSFDSGYPSGPNFKPGTKQIPFFT